MDLRVGEVIKTLRKERKLTQDKVADYLGVSFQTISKWENGTAYPDITYLPSIANFFNVSIDKLFSHNVSENDLYIDKIFNEYYNQSHDVEKEEVLLRETLLKFPGNNKIMLVLLRTLSRKDRKLNANEIIHLGNLILDDCTDDKIRWSTMIELIYTYKSIDKIDQSKEIIDRFPSMTNEDLLLSITTGSEKSQYIDLIKSRTIIRFSSVYSALYKEFKDKDVHLALKQLDKFIHLHKLLFESENTHVDFLIVFLIRKASLLLKTGDINSSIECIKLAYDHATNDAIQIDEKLRLKNLLKTQINNFKMEEINENQELKAILFNLEDND